MVGFAAGWRLYIQQTKAEQGAKNIQKLPIFEGDSPDHFTDVSKMV
jgi:hypothetical protein